jgi:hypothetical protein
MAETQKDMQIVDVELAKEIGVAEVKGDEKVENEIQAKQTELKKRELL